MNRGSEGYSNYPNHIPPISQPVWTMWEIMTKIPFICQSLVNDGLGLQLLKELLIKIAIRQFSSKRC